jgi:CheY-like chemotaxis protein
MSQSVLVLDDEADLLVTYERLLHRWGYRVTMAASVAAGLIALEHDRPDLVIADLRLPDGDGFQLVRAARATSRPPPIIIVTGVPSEDRRAGCHDGGRSWVPGQAVQELHPTAVRPIRAGILAVLTVTEICGNDDLAPNDTSGSVDLGGCHARKLADDGNGLGSAPWGGS